MDGRGAGLEPHAVAPALLHDLRLLKVELIDRRHDNAVARLACVMDGLRDLVILRLDRRKLGQQAHKVAVVGDREARLLAERPIEERTRQLQLRRGDAGAELDGRDLRAADALALAEGCDAGLHLADAVKRFRPLADGLIEPAFDRVRGVERFDPGGDPQVQLAERELIQDGFEDATHRRVIERQAVHGKTGHAIA